MCLGLPRTSGRTRTHAIRTRTTWRTSSLCSTACGSRSARWCSKAAISSRSKSPRLFTNSRPGFQVQPLRMGQPTSVQQRPGCARESVQLIELVVVHDRFFDAARQRYCAEVSDWSCTGSTVWHAFMFSSSIWSRRLFLSRTSLVPALLNRNYTTPDPFPFRCRTKIYFHDIQRFFSKTR